VAALASGNVDRHVRRRAPEVVQVCSRAQP
jgi:hypothetical protein